MANKKKMTSVVEKIGFSATQANILNVLGKYSNIFGVFSKYSVTLIVLSKYSDAARKHDTLVCQLLVS